MSSGLEFRIRYADGRTDRLLIDSDRVRIGSGAHCEVRLPPEHAAVDHALVTIHGGSVQVQALALKPPPTINGSPFTQAHLLPDSILGVGQVQVQVAIVEVAENENAIRKKKQGASPLLYGTVVLAVPSLLFFLLSGDPGEESAHFPDSRPALWPDGAAACPHRDPGQALALARDKRVLAEGKRERSPFVVQDGIAAVPLFEVAAACFKAAGDAGAAREMADAANRLRKELNEKYRAHQTRLEHVLAVGDERTAQQEVKVLLSILEGQTGDYVAALSNMDRKFALTLGKAENE